MDCEHPIQPTFATLHSSASVKVSRAEAIRIDTEDSQHLLEQRKLALIVDLDQTIIHVTVDPTVKEWAHDVTNPNWPALKDIRAFQLGADGKTVSHQPERLDEEHVKRFATDGDEDGCWYYVKLRPGLDEFLQALADKFELHVYTMGTRSYADCICRIVDPDGHLFGARILSRDENGSDVQKSLARLFPISTDMVAIIDDRADVWSWSPNLIKVEPYEFFVGIGDINASHLGPSRPLLPSTAPAPAPRNAPPAGQPPSLDEQQRSIDEQREARPLQRKLEEKLEQKAKDPAPEAAAPGAEPDDDQAQVLSNDDTELELIQTLLLELHRKWYEEYDALRRQHPPSKKRPDTKHVLRSMKKEVLKGCHVAFSGLIPIGQAPETAMIWTMAEDFGAVCHRDVDPEVTHVVAANPHTRKAEDAYRRGKAHVVWPAWLNDSMCAWVRQGELPYLIPRNTPMALVPDEARGLQDSAYSEMDPEANAAMANIANMDWNEAEYEVDAFLDDDDETESDVDSLGGSVLSEPETSSAAPTSVPHPSPKGRRIAALRGGPSKLRQSFLAEDLSSDDEADAAASVPSPPTSDVQADAADDVSPESTRPKRRRVDAPSAAPPRPKTAAQAMRPPGDSEDEHFLDDLAEEMERELGSDEEHAAM